MKRKFISLLLVLSALCSIVSPQVFASDITESEDELIQLQTSNGETVSVNQDEYDAIVTISEEEAKEIALLFVKDAIQLDDVAWDENTSITNVVPMYDETKNDVVTAYSIELNTGYVVVSAFRDTDSLIPEWSDRAEPLYDSLDLTSEEQVIYLGAYEYYADAGESEVVNLSGEDVNRNDLENNFEEQRNPDNVPAEITDDFVGIATYETILDPFVHANKNYKGPFVCNDYINKWDSSIKYYTTIYGNKNGYYGHCAPTAITNMILAVGTRYPSKLSYDNANSVFVKIANLGISNNYYKNLPEGGGTDRIHLSSYIRKSFNLYNVSPSVSACTQIAPKNAYEIIKNQLALNRLLYVSLRDNSIYCYQNRGHGVLCFAYTRLRSTSTGWYKTYMKVADGWNARGRYIDLADTNDTAYVSVGF